MIGAFTSRRKTARAGWRRGRFDALHSLAGHLVSLRLAGLEALAWSEIKARADEEASGVSARWRAVFRAAYLRGVRSESR
jgi:hypothetical protein